MSTVCVTLTIFSWTANKWIPQGVISRLEACWPDATLTVTNKHRHNAAAEDTDMDVRLLSSPLLYSLAYVFSDRDKPAVGISISEFTKLKDIVLRSPRLRVLYLKTSYKPMTDLGSYCSEVLIVRWNCDKPHPLNLDLQRSDPMPPLHESMVSDYPPDDHSREHREVWSHYMDWNQLHRHNTSNRCPRNFFEQLYGRVTNLKSLRMGLRVVRFGLEPMELTTETSALFRGFIESIDGLQELCITNYDNDISFLLPAIQSHRGTLQRFALNRQPNTDRYWNDHAPPKLMKEQLEILHRDFPKLTHLSIDLALEDGKWVNSLYSAPPPSINNAQICN